MTDKLTAVTCPHCQRVNTSAEAYRYIVYRCEACHQPFTITKTGVEKREAGRNGR